MKRRRRRIVRKEDETYIEAETWEQTAERLVGQMKQQTSQKT